MRFQFLTSCPAPWGGSEELWAGTALRLQDRGHHVRVGRSEPWSGGRRHPRWQALRNAGVQVTYFSMSGPGRLAAGATRRFIPSLHRPTVSLWNSWLAARLRLERPDLVIVSQGQAYDGCIPVCLPEICRFAAVPYVLVCHKAAEIAWPDDGARDLLRRCFHNAAAVFFVSEHNRRTLEQQLSITLPNAEVVRNPHMARVDRASPWPATVDGPWRLACVGRMWPLEKAQDVLLNVLALDHWRKRAIAVSFYGEGPMAKGLEEMARGLRLANVTFPGFADPTEIWERHHALVLPSRAEGLPLVEVEAMMCGRPVIVTNAGGMAEIMRDGEHGFLATSASVAAIDDALERAWARRADWEAMGEAAASHVRTVMPADACGAFAERLLRVQADLSE